MSTLWSDFCCLPEASGEGKHVPSGCVAKLLSQLKTNQGRKINKIVLFGVVVRILFFHSVCPRSSRKA